MGKGVWVLTAVGLVRYNVRIGCRGGDCDRQVASARYKRDDDVTRWRVGTTRGGSDMGTRYPLISAP